MRPWQTQDEIELEQAALSGDIEFLRACVASNKPTKYYLTPLTGYSNGVDHDNIFHLAVFENREEFIKEATQILPFETCKLLILQNENTRMFNPLHRAAKSGNVEIVKLFLNVFTSDNNEGRSQDFTSRGLNNLYTNKFGGPKPNVLIVDDNNVASSLPQFARPWLARSRDGQTPCHMALLYGKEDCGLELLKMDMEVICNIVDSKGFSLLSLAVFQGLNKVALEILTSPYPFSYAAPDQETAFHYVTRCTEGDAICRLLLERHPELIKQTSKTGFSVFHMWADEHKLWPFECLLKCDDIIPQIRKVFLELTSATHCSWNPLHLLASHDISTEKDDVEIAKLLIDTYKHEAIDKADETTSSSRSLGVVMPWLMEDKDGVTPLELAIDRRKEEFVMHILSVDDSVIWNCKPDILFFAIHKRCSQVAEIILNIVDEKGLAHRFLTNQHQLTVLHIAPNCENVFKQLLQRHPDLLQRVDKDGKTTLHMWAVIGEVWPFEYVLQSKEIDGKRRNHFIKLISATDYKDRNCPLHVLATTNHDPEAVYQISKILVEAYKEETPNWKDYGPAMWPWFRWNKYVQGPMHLAMLNQNEKLALYMLSLLHEGYRIDELLDYYKPEHKTLFLAMENNCFHVAREILAKLDKGSWTKYLVNSSNGWNVMHIASSCTDSEFGKWLVNEAPEFITQGDNIGITPMDEASNIGAAWIIQAILENNPSALTSAPLAWVKACENGHISAIHAFINYYPGKFRNHCIEHKDSPLHHMQLPSYKEYEKFLEIPGMMDLINIQDSQGGTPLHKAIQNGNIFLAEMLLGIDKTMYNIKNKDNKTAVDLLQQVCDEDYKWDQMCKSIGFDPRIKTTYFQRKTNLLDVRNAVSVVAALLATITFTAGFTLPGGLNQDTGEAMFANKAAFIVFLLSDTVAMCLSMLVLICVIWSMIYESSDKSLLLIDRSMILLLLSLYFTLIAFMTGVYMVISSKSLWVAILVIVMCSLIGLSLKRSLLYKVLLIPS